MRAAGAFSAAFAGALAVFFAAFTALTGAGAASSLLDVTRTGGVTRTGRLRRAHARLERGEQIDDLRRRRRGHRRLDRLLAGRLPLDEAEHLLAVLVLELLGIERRCQRLDELLGHRELALGDLDLVRFLDLGDRRGSTTSSA